MKKIILSVALLSICVLFMSFIMRPTLNETDVNSSWKAKKTETLYNSEYEITLTLYSNGYAALNSTNGPEGGEYDIDNNDRITLTWEKGGTERGFVTTVQTVSGKRIRTVVVNGLTLTNQERFIVSRSRR